MAASIQSLHHEVASSFSLTAALGVAVGVGFYLSCNLREPTAFGFMKAIGVMEMLVITSLVDTKTWKIAYSPWNILSYNVAFSLTLSALIVVYRLWLSPMAKFPGPLIPKLTKLAATYHAYLEDTPEWTAEMHAKYGDVVRLGPNELSFIHVDAISPLIGAHSGKVNKGSWYGGLPGATDDSVASTRDLAKHKLRRRIWDAGFSTKALKIYEPRIVEHITELTKQLQRKDNEVIDLSDWIDFWAYDVMADLGFGDHFGWVRSGKANSYRDFIHVIMRQAAIFSHIPWSQEILPYIPQDKQTKKDAGMFRQISRSFYTERKAKGITGNDIVSYLMTPDNKGTVLTDGELAADSGVIIAAGAEAIAVTITFLFHYLMKHPSAYERIQKEIDAVWDGSSPVDGAIVSSVPYLQALIYETMRLKPPEPNGNQRMVPEQGYEVQNMKIPGNTNFTIHTLTLQTDVRNFSKPQEFIPERWLENERPTSFKHDSRAWVPFNAGQYSCPGKGLSLLEIKLVAADLIKKFRFELDSSHDEKEWEASQKAFITYTRGALRVKLHKRDA